MKTLGTILNLTISTLAITATVVACNKSQNGAKETPSDPYVFTGPLDQLSGSYNMGGQFHNSANNTTINQACTTGFVSYTSRTQFCAFIRDEARNNNCAYEQRQNLFQQVCVNANTSNPTLIPGQPTVGPRGGLLPQAGPVPGPVLVNPAAPQLGTGLSKLITCNVTREKNSSIFTTSSSKTQSKIWKITESGSMHFSKSWFSNSGEAHVTLIPKSASGQAKIAIEFLKKTGINKNKVTKSASVEATIDSVVYLSTSDEEDQNQSTISCAVTNGQGSAVAASKTLNCEIAATTDSGEVAKVSKSFDWNGKNILETISFGKNDSDILILSAMPSVTGQPPQISVEIPHADHDLDVKAFGTLAQSPTIFKQKEQSSGFDLRVSCQLVP